MRRTAPRRVTASSVGGGRAASGRRWRIDCYTDVDEIRTAAGPSSAVQLSVEWRPVYRLIACAAGPGRVAAAVA